MYERCIYCVQLNKQHMQKKHCRNEICESTLKLFNRSQRFRTNANDSETERADVKKTELTEAIFGIRYRSVPASDAMEEANSRISLEFA